LILNLFEILKTRFLLQKMLLFIGHLCLVVLTISFGKLEWKFSMNQ